MKKILAGMICVTSVGTCATVVDVPKEEAKKLKLEELYFHKFEMDGHRYIVFIEASKQHLSVVHDPDCPCVRKEKNPYQKSI